MTILLFIHTTANMVHFLAITLITFGIMMLIYQIISYITRPSDKNRLWYLILLLILIYYNIATGILPSPILPFTDFVQNILAYFVCICLGFYLPFYVYKYTLLKSFKFYGYYGSLIFIVIPFFLLFLIPYFITKDVNFSGRLFIVIPFFYAIVLNYTMIKECIKSLNTERDNLTNVKIIGVTISLFLWSLGLSVVFFFSTNPLAELIVTNTGFLIISVLNVYLTINEARNEQKKIQESETILKKQNLILSQKVYERTQDLEKAIEQRTNAFISLAHETRTPLTLIICYLDEYVLKNEETEEIRIIRSNLLKLKNDLSVFFEEERLKQGTQPVFKHNKIIDFSAFVRDKIISFSNYARKKELKLTSNIQPELYIQADIDALHRICNNLIENSIKYTQAHGLINVTLTRNFNKIHFFVKDTGCGIPDDLILHVFKPYLRMDDKMEGIGIGLTIVQNAVNSLGGHIEVKSKLNHGSEFLVELQAYLHSDERALSESKSPEEIMNVADAILQTERPNILLVEDNIPLLSYLRNKLMERYNIYVANNGVSALLKLKNIPAPHLIISDIMMDEMDGIRFYKNLQENQILKHIPVIFLTARISQEKKLQALSMGAIDYISKPFSIHELTFKIDAYLNVIHKQRTALLHSAIRLMNNQQTPRNEKQDHKIKFLEKCRIFNITSREMEIIHLIAEGLTYKEMGVKLNLSEKTVMKHKQNIFEKVTVSSKVELLNKMMN